MAGGGGPVPKGTFKIVRYVSLNKAKLKQLAKLLEIPASDADDIFSGEIHIVPDDIQESWTKPKTKSKKP
jgi:hypothetical protein